MIFFKKRSIYISIFAVIYILSSGCAINRQSAKPITQSRIQFVNLFQNQFIEEKEELDLVRQVRFPLPKKMKSQLEATNYLLAVTGYTFANNLSNTDLDLIPLNPFWTNEGVMSIKKALMFTLAKDQILIVDHQNKLFTIFHHKDLLTVSPKNSVSNETYPEPVASILPASKAPDIKEKIVVEASPEPVIIEEPFLIEEGDSLAHVINKWAARSSLKPKFSFENSWLKNIVFTANQDHGLTLEESMLSLIKTLNGYPSLIERNISFKFKLNKKSLEIRDE